MFHARLRWMLAALLAVSVTAGCGGIREEVGDDMRQVLGQPLPKLVERWGPPTESRIAVGERLLTWELGADGITTTDDRGEGHFCNATVKVNEKNVVTGYYWSGNGCAAAADRL